MAVFYGTGTRTDIHRHAPMNDLMNKEKIFLSCWRLLQTQFYLNGVSCIIGLILKYSSKYAKPIYSRIIYEIYQPYEILGVYIYVYIYVYICVYMISNKFISHAYWNTIK